MPRYFSCNQIVVGQHFGRAVAPLAPHARVQVFGERLGQTIGKRLHHDRAVVVVLLLVPLHQLVGAEAAGDRKRAEVIGDARRSRRDEIGERSIRLPAGQRFLLPQHVEAQQLARARVSSV